MINIDKNSTKKTNCLKESNQFLNCISLPTTNIFSKKDKNEKCKKLFYNYLICIDNCINGK